MVSSDVVKVVVVVRENNASFLVFFPKAKNSLYSIAIGSKKSCRGIDDLSQRHTHTHTKRICLRS